MHFRRAAEFYCLFYVAQMRPSNRVRKEDQNFIPYLKFEKLKIHVSNITYQSIPYVSHENPWPSKTPTFIVEKANISNTCTESAKLRLPKKWKILLSARKFESLLLSVQVPRTFLTSFYSSFTLLLLPKREEASSWWCTHHSKDLRRISWSFLFGMHNPSISIWQLERPENSICVFTQATFLDFAEKWKEKLLRKSLEHVSAASFSGKRQE